MNPGSMSPASSSIVIRFYRRVGSRYLRDARTEPDAYVRRVWYDRARTLYTRAAAFVLVRKGIPPRRTA